MSDFLYCFQRFTARRGMLSMIFLDNAKEIRGCTVVSEKLVSSEDCLKYFKGYNIDGRFNLSSAPWWGGFLRNL